MKSFTVRIPEKLIDRLKHRAIERHASLQELVAEAITNLLKKRPEADADEA